jgi:hypothetical protein
MVVMAVALAAYGFDCSPMTTSEEAMQCCDSMACSSSTARDQDCCKTMRAMHVPFLPLFSEQGVSLQSLAQVSLAALPVSAESFAMNFSEHVPAQSKAPPIFSPPASLLLRI